MLRGESAPNLPLTRQLWSRCCFSWPEAPVIACVRVGRACVWACRFVGVCVRERLQSRRSYADAAMHTKLGRLPTRRHCPAPGPGNVDLCCEESSEPTRSVCQRRGAPLLLLLLVREQGVHHCSERGEEGVEGRDCEQSRPDSARQQSAGQRGCAAHTPRTFRGEARIRIAFGARRLNHIAAGTSRPSAGAPWSGGRRMMATSS